MKFKHFTLSIAILAILLTSCETEDSKKVDSSVVTEVYEVVKAESDYSKGSLRMMETEEYAGDKLISKSYYDGAQRLKGKEVYLYKKGAKYPYGSKYYGADDAIQSTYTFTYENDQKVKSVAREGEDGEVLRVETFTYNPNGHLASKAILNSYDQLQRKFLFSNDGYGNETEMQILNSKGDLVAKEGYEITKVGLDDQWLEKWGYKNNEALPVTFYKRFTSKVAKKSKEKK